MDEKSSSTNKNTITVETVIKAPVEKVWESWNKPEHIVNWAFASDDWKALDPKNDLRVGGKFKTTMAAKDKSATFDPETENTEELQRSGWQSILENFKKYVESN